MNHFLKGLQVNHILSVLFIIINKIIKVVLSYIQYTYTTLSSLYWHLMSYCLVVVHTLAWCDYIITVFLLIARENTLFYVFFCLILKKASVYLYYTYE